MAYRRAVPSSSSSRATQFTDLPGDVHGLLFHALAADDPEDCCSFFLSCKAVAQAESVRMQAPGVARRLVRELTLPTGLGWLAHLTHLATHRSRRLKKVTFVGKNTPAYESLLQLLRGCAQQRSFTHIQGPADALMAKVLGMLRSVETLCIDDEGAGLRQDIAKDLVAQLGVRLPRLSALSMYHSSGAAGTAALLSALAASPAISLHALKLPRLMPDQGVCAAIERLSGGRGARLQSAHLLTVPDAACAARLYALSELTLGPLPTYPAPENLFLGFKLPHLRRLSISPADNAAWSISYLLDLLHNASVPSVRRLQLGWYVQAAQSSASMQAHQLDAPLRALTASGDAPPIALAGRWELHAAGRPPIVVGPLSELVPVWQGACAGPFKGCKCVLLKGAVPAE